jgi:hypothetical protein
MPLSKRPSQTYQTSGPIASKIRPRDFPTNPPADFFYGWRSTVTPIRTKRDLDSARQQPRAFLFLWVNWAYHARSSQKVVEKVITTWHDENPTEPIPSYIADVSDQCGEVWDALNAWLEAERRPTGQLMMSGVGPLLWLRSGHVIVHVLAPLIFEDYKLTAISRGVFAPDAAG